MKELVGLAFLVFLITSANAVQTQVEFGPYINCVVLNDGSRPILVSRTDYAITGVLGPASQSFQCMSGCIIPPGGTIKMSGPANDSRITHASCNVVFILN
jgi:hypothetical protein